MTASIMLIIPRDLVVRVPINTPLSIFEGANAETESTLYTHCFISESKPSRHSMEESKVERSRRHVQSIYVSSTATSASPCGSFTQPCKTLEDGFAAARYAGLLSTHIDMFVAVGAYACPRGQPAPVNFSLTVIGTDAETTLVDCSNGWSPFVFHGPASVQGITVFGASSAPAVQWAGAGSSCAVSISSSIFIANAAGAMSVTGAPSALLIQACNFTDNTGALSVAYAASVSGLAVSITDSVFSSNAGSGVSGAVSIQYGAAVNCSFQLVNSTFASNSNNYVAGSNSSSVTMGGAVSVTYAETAVECSVVVNRSTFNGNFNDNVGSDSFGGALAIVLSDASDCDHVIIDSIFSGNFNANNYSYSARVRGKGNYGGAVAVHFAGAAGSSRTQLIGNLFDSNGNTALVGSFCSGNTNVGGAVSVMYAGLALSCSLEITGGEMVNNSNGNIFLGSGSSNNNNQGGAVSVQYGTASVNCSAIFNNISMTSNWNSNNNDNSNNNNNNNGGALAFDCVACHNTTARIQWLNLVGNLNLQTVSTMYSENSGGGISVVLISPTATRVVVADTLAQGNWNNVTDATGCGTSNAGGALSLMAIGGTDCWVEVEAGVFSANDNGGWGLSRGAAISVAGDPVSAASVLGCGLALRHVKFQYAKRFPSTALLGATQGSPSLPALCTQSSDTGMLVLWENSCALACPAGHVYKQFLCQVAHVMVDAHTFTTFQTQVMAGCVAIICFTFVVLSCYGDQLFETVHGIRTITASQNELSKRLIPSYNSDSRELAVASRFL